MQNAENKPIQCDEKYTAPNKYVGTKSIMGFSKLLQYAHVMRAPLNKLLKKYSKWYRSTES